VVERLPSKDKALSSNPSTGKNKKRKKELCEVAIIITLVQSRKWRPRWSSLDRDKWYS
jgi:hypothetical protein